MSPPVFAIMVCSKISCSIVRSTDCVYLQTLLLLDHTRQHQGKAVNRTGDIRSEYRTTQLIQTRGQPVERMATPVKGDLSASERKILQIIAAGELKL